MARWRLDVSGPACPMSFGEPDLRLANRGGARISAAQIAAILERRQAIEQVLAAIASQASLAAAADAVPREGLRELFDAFAGIRGVGFAKMTKALHPKRPALVPLLDSIVQKYLEGDDPGSKLRPGSRSARWGWYAATNAASSATGRRCERPGKSSRRARLRSPR